MDQVWATTAERWLVVALTVVLTAAALSGQVAGTVTDPQGRSIPGALVEAWSSVRRLAAQASDEAGLFTFAGVHAADVGFITVRAPGFAPRRVQATGAQSYHVVLAPFAHRLEAVAVTAAPRCPLRDQRNARLLWTTVAARVTAFEVGERAWTDARVSRSRVAAAQLGSVDTLSLGSGRIQAGGQYSEMHTQRMRDQGYAVPYQGLRGGRFDLWEYPRLESLMAGHFLHPAFGELHHMALRETDADIVIDFCPRNRDRPSIEGELRLDADSTLASVAWVFRTRGPEEIAGGEVFFARPARLSERPVLYPSVGLFWRKVINDYYQEWWDFLQWDSSPRTPQ